MSIPVRKADHVILVEPYDDGPLAIHGPYSLPVARRELARLHERLPGERWQVKMARLERGPVRLRDYVWGI